jgi:acyl-CoA thioester hydrolase
MMSGEIAIRVRYAETDRMGLLHHANCLVYFEQGRTELLRANGLSNKDPEDQEYRTSAPLCTHVTLDP